MTLEIEKTYLPKELPPGMAGSPHKDIEDAYIPVLRGMPLRLRRSGDVFEFTKKIQLGNDPSRHEEINVPLAEDQFLRLAKDEPLRILKTRYYHPWAGLTAEIDVFHGKLEGLVVVEFEFPTVEAMAAFEMPPFCLADVTSEELVSGGVLAGKTYADLVPFLERFGYKPLRP